MQIQAVKTHKITPADRDLLAVLDAYVPFLDEYTVLAITSKIVSICQERVVAIGEIDKQQLIESEADSFLPPDTNRYHVTLTIKDNILIPSAGIDESNSDHRYVLWPADPQGVANAIRSHLCRRFGRRYLAVLITDSKTTPLRWGVTGVAVAHSGFAALNDYIGRTDLFGRPLRMTKVNVADALAAAAVLVMGEGDEQTPLAVIHDLPFVQFQARNPMPEELQSLHIDLEDDLYAPLLRSVPWQRAH
ncbi:MAG: putative folate metabolism gamma-glutamate ligase [Chloroflexi bacterium]|nr:MAG: putative folate metabolism gamma-glutamate ligase [Chloroflexota bacterium]